MSSVLVPDIGGEAEVEKNKTQGDADCNVALDLLCFTGRKGEWILFPHHPYVEHF